MFVFLIGPRDCIVTPWSRWSWCSQKCGFGINKRSRQIIARNAKGGEKCPPLREKRGCFQKHCGGKVLGEHFSGPHLFVVVLKFLVSLCACALCCVVCVLCVRAFSVSVSSVCVCVCTRYVKNHCLAAIKQTWFFRSSTIWKSPLRPIAALKSNTAFAAVIH